jgi:outer membrane biosynthesis protein TonB
LTVAGVALFFLSVSSASAQVQIELKPNEKPTGEKKVQSSENRRQIPEASLPCSPEECVWWNALREAADQVRSSRGDKKDRKRFADLLQEGASKSYKPPIPDRKPLVLVQTLPQYTEAGRHQQISGIVNLRVEFLADGTIGKIQFLNQLGAGLDENAAAAARKAVFLPSVKTAILFLSSRRS